VGNWAKRYLAAIAFPVASVLAIASVGPRVTPLMCVFAGAAGVVVMAVADIWRNGRYVLANRAEEKRRLRRAEGKREPPGPPPDHPGPTR
jgi:hypothetical protein